jgi:hypothetical protein
VLSLVMRGQSLLEVRCGLGACAEFRGDHITI